MIDLSYQALNNRPASGTDRTTFWEIARWVSLATIFMALLLAYAWMHMEILNINYQIQHLKKENHELEESNSALRAEHSSLVNPTKIDQLARNMGMVAPEGHDVRILEAEPLPLVPSRNMVAESLRPKAGLHE